MMDVDELGSDQGSGKEKKSIGLQFPVRKIARLLVSQKYGVSRKYAEPRDYRASVFLSAVLQYLSAEVLELAGNVAKDDNKPLILSRHIQSVADNDQILNKLLSQVLELFKDIDGDICKDLTIMMGQVTMKN